MTPLDTHRLLYRIRNNDRGNPSREVEVRATPDELAFFAERGYFVREGLFPSEHVERLKTALDEVADAETKELLGEPEGLY